MRAGIYTRISEDRDETQLGVGRQMNDCERLAAARGWDIVERYVDNDISAWKGGRRPDYMRMLDDITDHHIDSVIVWHQDRLVRQPRELEQFFDICDRAGVKDLASVSGDVDLGTSDGRFKARILGSVAAKESDDKSRRIRRKMEELARNGQNGGGGTRPFGFEDDRVTIRRSEAKVIREHRRAVAQRCVAPVAVRRSERAGCPHPDRPPVEAGAAEADAPIGPHLGSAGASRRDRRQGGVAGDHPSRADDADPGDPGRPFPPESPRAAVLSAEGAAPVRALWRDAPEPPA